MTRPFSVYGYFPHNSERFGEVYEATSARAAEDLARMQASDDGLVFRVAGVLEGEVPSVDRYTLYVDARDVRNADAENLAPDVEGLEMTEFTVLGLLTDPRDHKWNERTGGQRFCDHVLAFSPLFAEDVAVSRVREDGGVLSVCAVFTGRMQRADVGYARFSNPDVLVAD